MEPQVKILVIEDTVADFLLLERYLRHSDLVSESKCISSDAELQEALQNPWDVVLADYNVPGMEFLTSLKYIREHNPDLPVILLSGSVGEETAVDLLLLGVTDFILKDHMVRLPSAIKRVLQESIERRARRSAEMELHKLAQAVEQSPEIIAISGLDATIEYVNETFVRTTGYSREEVIGKNLRILQSGKTPVSTFENMWGYLTQGKVWKGEFLNRRKDGTEYTEQATISPIRQMDGRITHYVSVNEDITEKKFAEAEIHRLAFYDTLTGLANRSLLQDRLQHALAASARSGQKGALLFIDLDDFKTLNDTLGHDYGDELLKQVALRLSGTVREGDTVSRLGGDEFVIILEHLSEEMIEAAEQTEFVANKILAKLNQPYQIFSHECRSTPSIGAALIEDHLESMDELMKQADIAMYQAKKAGRNTICFFDPQMQHLISTRAALEGDLRKAVERQQFHLYYQIQVDDSGCPIGAEALIRWIHPERGLVSPAQFIPLAEECGLISSIGDWVLETACAQLKLWQKDAHTRDLLLAINVSANQFHKPYFATQVVMAIEKHGIDPTRLKLELTESMLLDNIDGTIATMEELKAMGVHLSLDDFGTGFSSLQYLKKLPIDQLKIDQSFVRDLSDAESDKAIVRTIVGMAHSLNLEVIAEGVETGIQLHLLKQLGCTHFQGYLFSKPLPIGQFASLLEQGLDSQAPMFQVQFSTISTSASFLPSI